MTPIMLFAAGLGTRMGHLVKDRPKPLVTVAGHALIDHALQLTQGQPVATPVVNLHYKAAMLRDHLADRDVRFSDETDLLRDTGGGLKHALPKLGDDPVMTLNTDAVWVGPNPIAHLLNAWRDDMDALLLLVPRSRFIGYTGPGNFLIDDAAHLQYGDGPIYTGLQMIRTNQLHDISDEVFSMHLLWQKLIADGTMFGSIYPGKLCDVGRPESIPLAEKLIAETADV